MYTSAIDCCLMKNISKKNIACGCYRAKEINHLSLASLQKPSNMTNIAGFSTSWKPQKHEHFDLNINISIYQINLKSFIDLTY